MAKTPIISADDTNTVQMIIRAVPKNIHRIFKACCAAKDKTMRDRIIELMTADVADYNSRKK